jgi:hypothetical protein
MENKTPSAIRIPFPKREGRWLREFYGASPQKPNPCFQCWSPKKEEIRNKKEEIKKEETTATQIVICNF